LIETYYAGVYWGVREESVENCAQRLTQVLNCLAACEPALTHWFEQGRTRKEALAHEVPIEAGALQKLLLSDHKPTHDEGSHPVDLGFSTGLWNGYDGVEGLSLITICGSYNVAVGSNSCVLKLPPYAGPVAQRLLTSAVLERILQCLVLAWEPDWGVVNSNNYLRNAPTPADKGPRLGWMVYLSQQRGAIPPLPPPVRALPVATLGTLISVTDERFTTANPEHLTAAERVRTTLDHAGLLGPLR